MQLCPRPTHIIRRGVLRLCVSLLVTLRHQFCIHSGHPMTSSVVCHWHQWTFASDSNLFSCCASHKSPPHKEASADVVMHVTSCHVMSLQYFAIAFKTSLQLFSCTYAICMLDRTTDSLLLDPAYIMVTLWHSWSPTNGELWSGGGGDILTSGIELSVVDMPVWWFDLWPWQRKEMASSFSTDQRKTNK